VAERNAAGDNLTSCVGILTDHLREVYEGARRELPKLSKYILGSDALARLSDMLSEIDEAVLIAEFVEKLKEWREDLAEKLELQLAALVLKIREQLKIHAFPQFDRLFGYLSSICESTSRSDATVLGSLKAEFNAELGRFDGSFAVATKSGDYRKVDEILRSLDFVAVTGYSDSIDLRSDICESCSAKSRELLQRFYVELEELCKHAEKCLSESNLEIFKAHECLEHLGKLQSSDFMRRDILEEYTRLKVLFKVVKQDLLKRREIVNNAVMVNKCAREFRAVDEPFFRHRRDTCLDELEADLDACKRGLHVMATNPRSLADYMNTMEVLVKYEIALGGLGCDEEIKRNKEDLFRELEDTLNEALTTLEVKMTEGAWNEVEKQSAFVKFALDDVWKKCNLGSEKERGTLQAKLQELMLSLDEKAKRLQTCLEELRSIDLQDPTTVDAQTISNLLRELDHDKSFLEGPFAKKFEITSFEAACNELNGQLDRAAHGVNALWKEKAYEKIRSIERSLRELAKVDRIPKASTTKRMFQAETAKALDSLKEAARSEFAQYSSAATQTAKIEKLRLVSRLIEDAMDALQVFDPERFDDHEKEILGPIQAAIDRIVPDFQKNIGIGKEGWSIKDVADVALQLWAVASEFSHAKIKARARATLAEVFKAQQSSKLNFMSLATELDKCGGSAGGELRAEFGSVFKEYTIQMLKTAEPDDAARASTQPVVTANFPDQPDALDHAESKAVEDEAMRKVEEEKAGREAAEEAKSTAAAKEAWEEARRQVRSTDAMRRDGHNCHRRSFHLVSG
jgi:hypothetical protein